MSSRTVQDLKKHINRVATMTVAREQVLTKDELLSLSIVARRLHTALHIIEKHENTPMLWLEGAPLPYVQQELRHIHSAIVGT
jgi:hypothetical protein